MVPAAGQGIIGVTVRETDTELRELLAAHRGPCGEGGLHRRTRACWRGSTVPAAPRSAAMRRLLPDGELHLTGLVARADGSFLLKRSLHGPVSDADRIGSELGASLRADSPPDLFA